MYETVEANDVLQWLIIDSLGIRENVGITFFSFRIFRPAPTGLCCLLGVYILVTKKKKEERYDKKMAAWLPRDVTFPGP